MYPAFANSVDLDQLASEEANWSGSALFAIKNVYLYQQSGSSNLIGWKLDVGVASLFSRTRVKMFSAAVVVGYLRINCYELYY